MKCDRLKEDAQRVIKRIVARQQHLARPMKVESGVSEAQVERAKAYPIHELYDGEVRGGMAKCPFHDDKTASLSFRRYNRFRCFGCDERGTTIDFYMKLHGCSFIDAVRVLSRI